MRDRRESSSAVADFADCKKYHGTPYGWETYCGLCVLEDEAPNSPLRTYNAAIQAWGEVHIGVDSTYIFAIHLLFHD